MIRRMILLVGFSVLFVAAAFATGIVEQPQELSMDEAVGEVVVIRGTLSLYGNEPVTFLGLLTRGAGNEDILADPDLSLAVEEDTVFQLAGSLISELTRWQATRVEITGRLERSAVGPGMPALVVVESFTVPDQ